MENESVTPVRTPEEEVQRKLTVLLRVGSMLVGSLADTGRILRNLKRVSAYLGLPEKNLHLFVNYTMLMVNLSDKEHSYTKFQRCDKHVVNMTAIESISKLSWRAIEGDYSLDRFEHELDKIENTPPAYTPWQVALGGGFACGGFCLLFGSDWPAFFYASLAAMVGFRLRAWLNASGSNIYMNVALASLVATLVAWLSSFLSLSPAVANVMPAFMHSDTPWHPLMACALFVVPGVPLINLVLDMLNGHIQIGIVRAVNALLILLSMSFAIAFAVKICGMDSFATDLSMVPHHSYFVYALAAAISAMGFSMIFNIPRRLLWVVALGGAIAVCVRNFVNLGPSTNNIGLDQGLIIGSFAGSALVSILGTRMMHVFHTPHHCLAIPSVIPMIPGVLMYRALFAFTQMHGVVGEVTVAMHYTIMAFLTTLCISLGVGIPNVFIRHMINPKRKRKLLDLVSRRTRMRNGMLCLKEGAPERRCDNSCE